MIWIVTDNLTTRKGLLTLGGEMGYAVASHECAEDVRAQMRFARPRLLIVDCELPDGFALIRSIREDVRVGGTCVIVFSAAEPDANPAGAPPAHDADAARTAAAAAELERTALAHGADAFVAKGALDWAQLRPKILRLAGPPPEG